MAMLEEIVRILKRRFKYIVFISLILSEKCFLVKKEFKTL
jgi:hypothetical protein